MTEPPRLEMKLGAAPDGLGPDLKLRMQGEELHLERTPPQPQTRACGEAVADVENAVFISKCENLHYWRPHFSRLYFGQEFCDRLIPLARDLDTVLDFVNERSLDFTLLTPYLTDDYLKMTEKLLACAAERVPGSEVVVNDFGVLDLVREKYPQLVPVLGRLLTKQKRGPRIMKIVGKVPESLFDHYRRSNVDLDLVIEFLREYGVRRVELDNLLQGVERDSTLPASLYYPYTYVTTTRLCITASADSRLRHENNVEALLRAIFPCQKECQKFSFVLRHKDMTVPLLLHGNSQFYYLEELPKNLQSLGIDRVVYQPEVPI